MNSNKQIDQKVKIENQTLEIQNHMGFCTASLNQFVHFTGPHGFTGSDHVGFSVNREANSRSDNFSTFVPLN